MFCRFRILCATDGTGLRGRFVAVVVVVAAAAGASVDSFFELLLLLDFERCLSLLLIHLFDQKKREGEFKLRLLFKRIGSGTEIKQQALISHSFTKFMHLLSILNKPSVDHFL